MLNFNCLLDTPQLRTYLRDYVELTGYDLARRQIKPSLQNVYNQMRKDGIEIDLISTTYLYGDVFASQASNGFTMAKELSRIRGDQFAAQIRKRAAVIRKNEIGRLSPVDAVVGNLVSLVQPDSTLPPTIQKKMQQGLLNAAKRVLDKKGLLPKPVPGQPETMDNILQRALAANTNQAFGPKGYLATADVLWAEFQQAIDKMATEMENAVDAKGNPAPSYGAAELRQYADMLQQASYDFLLSSREVKDIISETLKVAGFTKQITLNGQPKLVPDWTKIHDTKNGLNFRNTLTRVLEGKKDAFGNPMYSPADIAKIVPFLDREYTELMQAKAAVRIGNLRTTATNAQIDRLAKVASIGAFQQEERRMILDMLGVDDLTKSQVDAIERLVLAYNDFMQMNMADLSPTFFATIERHIRVMLEDVKEDRDAALKRISRFERFSQVQSSFILVNLGNALIENTSSGLAELLNTAVLNPRQALQSAKVMLSIYKDVALGGVRQGADKSNLNDAVNNSEDKYSWELAPRTIKGMLKGVATGFQRLTLSATDAAFKGYLWKSMEVKGLVLALQAQGVSNGDAHTIINEAYFGNQAQIEQVAKDMVAKLDSIGVASAKGKWQRIASELAAANLISNGQYFKDIIADLELRNRVAKGTGQKVSIDKPLLLSIRKAANAAAARGLGHAPDVMATSLLDRAIVWAKGDQNATAGDVGRRVMVSSIFRFVSGALKWTSLNLYKSSGLGVLTTLIFDMGIKKRGAILKKDVFAAKLKELEAARLTGDQGTYAAAMSDFNQQLERGMAVRQRLARSTIQPAVSYIMFTTVIGPLLRKAFGCEGDNPECFEEMMLEIKANGWDNVLNKVMPIAAANYLNSLVDHKPEKGNYFNFEAKENPVKGLADSYLTTIPYAMWAKGKITGDEVGGSPAADNYLAFLKNNINDDPLFGLIERLTSKGSDKAPVEIGKFIGKAVNLGGIFKMGDINQRYVNTLQGKPNHAEQEEFEQYKPSGFTEAMAQQWMLDSWYRSYKDSEFAEMLNENEEE